VPAEPTLPSTAPSIAIDDDVRVTVERITSQVVRSFDGAPDPRLRQVLSALVTHLHAFALDVALTQSEWESGIAFLTAAGQKCDDQRQELILLSDALGFSMVVDAVSEHLPTGATESTVLGPFYVADSPRREFGDSTAELPSGEPTWVHGVVRDLEGRPIAGAELDVWQNADDRLYAVQNPEVPQGNLRGRFTTRDDGSYGFAAVRPTDYPIPTDGPVGDLLRATGRQAWRPAHLHLIVRAPGYRTLTTHVFDSQSEHLASDAVFAVKPSLVRTFVEHEASDPARPPGIDGPWTSVENDVVLAPVGR
jgi:hydroxyquinol 1,2-dioxygenase